MIGELYALPAIITHNADGSKVLGYCRSSGEDTHLLVLDIVPGMSYRNCDTIAHCLSLETGKPFKIYTDVLATDGVRIS